jgi:hypothetical protein
MQKRTAMALLAATLFSLGALGSSQAWGQSEPEDDGQAPAAPSEGLDEIVVRGERTLGAWRAQLQAARERMYDAFNALNSNNEFNIYCRTERRTDPLEPAIEAGDHRLGDQRLLGAEVVADRGEVGSCLLGDRPGGDPFGRQPLEAAERSLEQGLAVAGLRAHAFLT